MECSEGNKCVQPTESCYKRHPWTGSRTNHIIVEHEHFNVLAGESRLPRLYNLVHRPLRSRQGTSEENSILNILMSYHSGKTTLSFALEEFLVSRGIAAYGLDGDNIRFVFLSRTYFCFLHLTSLFSPYEIPFRPVLTFFSFSNHLL